MADPFAEFGEVQEEHVKNDVLVGIAGSDEMPAIAVERDSTLPSFTATIFHPDYQQKAEEHYQKRCKYEVRVNAKLREIHETMERLYTVRYEADSDIQEQQRNTKNLLTKLNILNEELAQMRQKQMKMFEKQLSLDDIGLMKRIRTSSFRKKSGVEFTDPDAADETDGLLGAETSGGGFMRTKSTNTLKDKPAEAKWSALFRMFREHRFQTNAATGQHLANADERTIVGEEVLRLRTAIQSLQQRGNLSKSDEILLKILTAKLRAVRNLNKEGE